MTVLVTHPVQPLHSRQHQVGEIHKRGLDIVTADAIKPVEFSARVPSWATQTTHGHTMFHCWPKSNDSITSGLHPHTPYSLMPHTYHTCSLPGEVAMAADRPEQLYMLQSAGAAVSGGLAPAGAAASSSGVSDLLAGLSLVSVYSGTTQYYMVPHGTTSYITWLVCEGTRPYWYGTTCPTVLLSCAPAAGATNDGIGADRIQHNDALNKYSPDAFVSTTFSHRHPGRASHLKLQRPNQVFKLVACILSVQSVDWLTVELDSEHMRLLNRRLNPTQWLRTTYHNSISKHTSHQLGASIVV